MMKIDAVTILDFETEGIKRRPHYPPVPASFSIKKPGMRAPEFWSWGHPTENNCTKDKAMRVLRDTFRESLRQRGPALLFQNGKFDVDVAETHCDVPRLPWEKIHDTMFLLALHDPHAETFSLKPSAQRILGMMPEEQDKVKEWILGPGKVKGTWHVPEAHAKPSQWGAYICRAPGKLVGRYANGDIVRTERLFNHLMPQIIDRGMLEAYNRERELMPIILESERRGIRVDVKALERDYSMYQQALGYADNWLRKALHAPNLNLDADKDVAEVLDREGVVTEWVLTAKGHKSVAKKNMTLDMFENQRVASVYGYRVRLATCLRMFFEPWLEMARESNGFIYTNWNQVRQSRGENVAGARTGRLSSNPNFQNIPTDWYAKGDGYVHPKFLKALPELPTMRVYWLPDPGDSWIKRDFAQQELRILAHFEDGDLMRKYNGHPDYDLHKDVQTAVREIAGLNLPRGPIKILNFGDIYGMGFSSFFEKTKISKEDYDKIKAAKKELLPDLAELDAQIKEQGKLGLPIRTWGGREYYCEPPMYVKKFNRVMSFEYKLLNYLIQGSAADCTKQCVINYHKHPKRTARFLLTVHDELNASAKKSEWKQQQAVLRESMSNVKFDVPMLSDGSVGPNWGTLKDCK
jgi:DNA polymerase I-like protein with 3'-5' exonuclease and polymerase domains